MTSNTQADEPAELGFPEPLPEPLLLIEPQQRVYEALKEHSGDKWQFGDWYLGALTSIRIQGPDYLAQAANSIREITEKLPEFAGIPLPESPVNKTKAAVATILKLRLADYSEGWESQSINPELAKALELLEDLQPLFDLPSRKKMLQAALERRDRYSLLLAPELRRHRDKQFAKLGDFFQNVTHHRHVPSHEAFLIKLSEFEKLISYYLTPVTAAQQTEITEITDNPPTPESESRLGRV